MASITNGLSDWNSNHGFTLLEVAVVLLIIGLLVGGMLAPLSRQIEQRKISETQLLINENKEALIGFAVTRGYLPCPAVSAVDGNEGLRTGESCNNFQGFLPWVVLGTAKSDSWARLLRYSVSPDYSKNTKPTFTSKGIYKVRPTSSIPIPSPTDTIASDIPAIIYSHGPNGYGSRLENGALIGNSASNLDEQANVTNSVISSSTLASTITVVSRVPTENTAAPGGEFDDIVTWIPSSILFNRMVAAGQLP